jgi:tetratricopeptide (TPR) repeat protein
MKDSTKSPFWLRWGMQLFVASNLAYAGLAGAAQFPRKEPIGFTWGQLAVLPEYCKDTQGTVWDTRGNGGPESPNLPKWLSLMGEDFFHVHHYCYGLRNLLQAQAVGDGTPAGRQLLGKAIGEFTYMIKACQATMPLMPEIYLKRGETFLRLGDVLEAKSAFERSRELKPDYWPAYTRWADSLVGFKQFEAAKKLLLEGLNHSPDEPELRKRLAALEARVSKTSPGTPGKPSKEVSR